jgi:hypothetical protein
VVSVRYGAGAELPVRPGETREEILAAVDEGFPYYDTWLHVLRFRSRTGRRAGGSDPRVLGAFLEIAVEAERRP